jgi:tetratricopeptide (TPR) repeat protein
MMRMVDNLNRQVLPLVPERKDPPVAIKCDTCHRGITRPITLLDDMLLTSHTSGVDSAITRYRALREDYETSGTYDFGEWEINDVAEKLFKEGSNRDAIAMFQLNEEFHPESPSIVGRLAQLFEAEGDTLSAIRYYERRLELRPGDERTMNKLNKLRQNH